MSTPVAKKDSITCITDNSELRQNVMQKRGGGGGGHEGVTHTYTHTHTQSPPLLTRSRGEYLRVVGMPVMVEQIGRYV